QLSTGSSGAGPRGAYFRSRLNQISISRQEQNQDPSTRVFPRRTKRTGPSATPSRAKAAREGTPVLAQDDSYLGDSSGRSTGESAVAGFSLSARMIPFSFTQKARCAASKTRGVMLSS